MSDLPLPVPEPVPEQALNIQHDTDPARQAPGASHVPHLGHAALFFSIIGTSLLLSQALFYEVGHLHSEAEAVGHAAGLLLAEALAYVTALSVSVWFFPRLWHRSFAQGIQWNGRALRRLWYWLLPGALVLSGAAQTALHFVAQPKDTLMEHLLATPLSAWCAALFGSLLAPLVEEIAFRGFLLPALATAYDWLLLERTPAGLQRWQSSAEHSLPALAFAAIFSSVPFALLHAGQLSHAWGAVGILYGVSLVLSLVRIASRSTACSALLHGVYNFTIFALVFVQTGGFQHLDKLRS